MSMKICLTVLLVTFLPALGAAQETPRTPEFIAERKADRLYGYFLDAMMPNTAFNAHNLTFRIANNLLSGSDGEKPEFYLMTPLHVDWVEIKYREQTSIYTAIYQYFLDNPRVTLDELDYWPALIHKRITYQQCPKLQEPIVAVEQYIRNSLISAAPYEASGMSYLVGYRKDFYDLTFAVDSKDARPVAELLKIRDIALRCARDLPTVEEAELAERLKREQEQAELIRNFKGTIHDSPPPIVLRHGSRAHQSAIGTNCWGIGTDVLCDDVFAIVTPSTPIVVRRGDRLAFEIPERDRLASMSFSITRVTRNDIRKRESDRDFPEIIIWDKEVREREMTAAQLDSILIDKPPGQYILTLFGMWADYGDAVHGFYLKVTP